MTASLPIRESRNVERAHFDDPVRISLLEQDADKNDRQHAEILAETRSVKKWMMAVAASATSATIVGAINLVIGKFG